MPTDVIAASARASWKRAAWRPIARTATSPAAWFFGAVWLVAVGALVLRGYVDRALGAPVILLPILVFSWLTVLLTERPPGESGWGTTSRSRLIAQTAVVAVIVSLMGLSAMALFGVGPRALASIPVWSSLFGKLLELGGALPVSAPAAISNATLEFLVPLAALLALGARSRELGLGPGHRVWRVLGLWSALQLVSLSVAVVTGQAQLLRLVGHFIRNAFQNGFVEEFLFRGALQTRLSRLLGSGWGVVLASVIFGVWHLGTNARFETNGDLMGAACAGIAGQAPFGVGAGVILLRTRNLLAGSLFHMLVDLP